ncbi:TPA: DNA-binding protein [Enterobacter hormaechei]|uniref:DNA-binding protein n=1 Tax=Enterobacter hormaechei TaxID=158836 RepID=UPI0019807F38|nr:DNA-binding protein [Enterobacter hormaechei]ELD3469028.1 DNA-binding protein [Enterobacter hormaechei]MBN4797678.1 DNA-binding protein [Enterobacter hormaechei]MBN4821812.1 DNA-binding protein [Enterobacter hormaechei]MED5729949.1 DNA-binding protein [Enterobacter hormaechei]HBM2513291.1 DNA-binding protein [Enterobacter hormaechei]
MLLTKAAYARHCGVSRQTVYDWVAKGEVVMSGNKIDVEATEQRTKGEHATNSNTPAVMPALQLAQWVHAHYGKYPAAKNQDEAKRLLTIAVKLIAYDIEFLVDDDGDEFVRIYWDDSEDEHVFWGFDQLETAMYFIRDSFYSECLECDLRGIRDYYSIDPDGDRITMEALIALCSPVETEEARIKRFHGESD